MARRQFVLNAVDGVRENKQRYAEAEAQAALKTQSSMAGLTSYMMRMFAKGSGDDES